MWYSQYKGNDLKDNYKFYSAASKPVLMSRWWINRMGPFKGDN